MQIVLIHKQALSQFTSFQRRAKFPEHSCNVVPILTRRKSVSNELRRMIMARHSSNKFKRFAASRLKFIPNKLAALLYVEPSITTEKMKSQVKHEILEKYIILCNPYAHLMFARFLVRGKIGLNFLVIASHSSSYRRS